ncbi:MAG: TIGR02300 family protein [Alphaproteobacteria bacterium]|nr:TIGR02300 family protein [Alphaproteobacteria bacterium]
MSKPEWGTKRICQSCTIKFYDFGRTPITCPKCSAVFDPETLLKSRRNRPSAAAKSSKPPAPVLSKPKDDDPTDTADVEKTPDAEDEDESTIEDASELGEDDEETSKEIVPSKSGED